MNRLIAALRRGKKNERIKQNWERRGKTTYAVRTRVKMDKSGSNIARAITLYQKSHRSLLQLVQLYSCVRGLEQGLRSKSNRYQERNQALNGSVSANWSPDGTWKRREQNGVKDAPEGGKGHGSVMSLSSTEKPQVSGMKSSLDTAKKLWRSYRLPVTKYLTFFPLSSRRDSTFWSHRVCGKNRCCCACGHGDRCKLLLDWRCLNLCLNELGEAEQNVAKLFGSARKSSNEARRQSCCRVTNWTPWWAHTQTSGRRNSVSDKPVPQGDVMALWTRAKRFTFT